ncbi:hypothetical protein QLI02_002079 [Salmonella enterica]|nr:hypothetical protein [Salmonella enterica subsp. enterica]ELV9472465.1 hypothetical protein [Salmonella enterica]ELW7406474.1 hypothetical protein [Salmonella enterica]HDO6127111.1 hypothetical protein [Salmonella enterica subsp. enterica serovar Typhimurium]
MAAAIKRWPLLAEFAQPHSLRKP